MGNCINKQEISDESSISSIEEIRSEKNFKSKKSNRFRYFPPYVLKTRQTKKAVRFASKNHSNLFIVYLAAFMS